MTWAPPDHVNTTTMADVERAQWIYQYRGACEKTVYSDFDLNERSEREQAMAQRRVVAQFGSGAGMADAALFENVDPVGERQ